jgi:hypothetical protein
MASAAHRCAEERRLRITALANEDNIIASWKKSDGVGCYIQHNLGMVFLESSNAGSVMEETFSTCR